MLAMVMYPTFGNLLLPGHETEILKALNVWPRSHSKEAEEPSLRIKAHLRP